MEGVAGRRGREACCFGLALLGLAWLGLAWLGLAWLGCCCCCGVVGSFRFCFLSHSARFYLVLFLFFNFFLPPP